MIPAYLIEDTKDLLTPSLLFYKEAIHRNILRILSWARHPQRLRPHVKTHKTREITKMMLDQGITKLKVATIAEAEMVADVGTPDILLSYPLVGPNCGRFAQLMKKFPNSRFSTLVDHPRSAQMLSDVMVQAGLKVDVLLDVDVGQHRTGISIGPAALELYASFATLPGLRPDGLHIYDGHNHQEAPEDRQAAVDKSMVEVQAFKHALKAKGLPVPRLVVGGTPTFGAFSKMELPDLECSPGTCVLSDHGYGSRFRDLADFMPAALVLSRVISRPLPDLVTLDLGYKAIASDPPAGKRAQLLNVPDFEPVLQNEEHFVVRTPAASQFFPGDIVYAMPTHICPTSAMHKFAYVVEGGRVTGTWDIVGRDRKLTI